MNARTKSALALLTIAVAAIAAGGCAQIQDWTSRAMGLPTNAEIQLVKDELSLKDQELAATDALRRKAESMATNAERAAERSEALRTQAQETASEIAGRMAEADDPVEYQSLATAWKAAQSMVEKYAGLSGEASQRAADFLEQVATLESQRSQLDQRIRALEMELEGIDEQRAAKFAALGASVESIGAQAQALGVPGATTAAEQANAVIQTITGVIFGGGTLGGLTAYVANRRRKRDVNEMAGQVAMADQEAATERKRAEAALEVIAVTEEFDLIKDDAEAKERARLKLSDDARAALGQGKAKASPRRVALRQPAAAA